MKNGKDAPLLADPLPLKEEEKKPWRQVDLNSRPLDCETIVLTTLQPPLPY